MTMWRDLTPMNLLILAGLVALLFGWKKLPDIARSVGRSMRIFKSEVSEMKTDGRESRPSPAAGDTVPGSTVPPPAAQPVAPPAAQPGPQPAAPTAPTAPQPADRPADRPAPQPHHDNPAL